MKKRIISLLLALVMTAAMTPAAFADFTYPTSYWPLHDAWESALPAGDTDQIISLAQQVYDLLSPYGLVKDVCLNLDAKCAQAAWACEIKGDLNGAVTWLERQRTFAQWLNTNGYDREDSLIIIEAQLNQLKTASNTAIYALTDQQGNVYSGSGAPAAGTLYGSSVGASRAGESAVLMYIDFADGYSVEYWVNYYRDHYPIFQKAIEEGGVIEVAWNFHPESTAGAQVVLSSANDSYISEGLSALGQLNATVLLRLGAEMNVWPECDSSVFIQAFRKIAQGARRYSNIKTVFSPNYVSVWGTDFRSFYPGDEYVDWIGMSDYHHYNYAGPNGAAPAYSMSYTSSGSDAYYNRGFYDNNPLTLIAPIAGFAQTHNKPMMISECGFSYRDNHNGVDMTSYAVDSLTKYYSYINMIYPQVKAVFHFNHTMPGEQYAYELSGSPALNSAYNSVIAANGAYITQGQTTGKTWQPLDKVDQKTDGKLKLAVYALFPGKSSTTVKYFVDGAQVFTSSQAPHYYELDTAALSAGKHTVRAESTSGQFSLATQTYTIYVVDNQVSAREIQAPPPAIVGSFTDVSATAWYAEPVQWAVENGVTAGTTDTTFSPDATCTKAQILSFLWRASGRPEPGAANPFTDVEESDYYYKAALWAAEKGIVSGSTFDAGTDCTRAMTVEYLWKHAGSPVEGTSSFTDVPADAPYLQAVAWAVKNNITSGMGDGLFSPGTTCTRGQIVSFLYRDLA